MKDKIYGVLAKYGIDEPKASAITEDLLFLCTVVEQREQLKCRCIKDPLGSGTVLRCCDECAKSNKF